MKNKKLSEHVMKIAESHLHQDWRSGITNILQHLIQRKKINACNATFPRKVRSSFRKELFSRYLGATYLWLHLVTQRQSINRGEQIASLGLNAKGIWRNNFASFNPCLVLSNPACTSRGKTALDLNPFKMSSNQVSDLPI